MNILRQPEAKVVLALVLLLGGMELGARLFEEKLSKDVKHIRSLPGVSAKLKAAPAGAYKVLILGNSLSRDGLDQALLKVGIAKIVGREVELAAMYPDGSSISQWYYGYRRYFMENEVHPDLVILGTGRTHLLDGPLETDRLAAFYTSAGDLPALLKKSGDLEDISKALVARSSALFAHRGRVQPLVFYNSIPGYTETTQNLTVQRPTEGEGTVTTQRQESCELFAKLLKTFQSQGSQVVVTAIPLPKPYALPGCVKQAAAGGEIKLIEEGSQLQLDAKLFPDGYHLNKEGAALFTQQLLEWIKL